ncbi:hypothetical protein BASA60_003312 [Batrachochytrium salamandrivorans]|nr:hypothetical protein BASA60_003312 [Batrachochytrium salamandrivorans]
MIYISYARIAIIVALMSASVAMPIAQDPTSVRLEKRVPQDDIEDVSDSPQPPRRPKAEPPLPGWTRQSTHSSQVSSSQAARPISRLDRRPLSRQGGSSQIESSPGSNSESDMQNEQDPANSHASQGASEDDEMSSPGSSTGGSHGTLPKGATLKSQSKLDCRGGKCKLPRMTDKEFSRRDKDLRFITTDGELTGTYSRDTTMIPYTYKEYLATIQKIENNNEKKRKAEEKKETAAAAKKRKAEERETKEVRKQVGAARKRIAKTNPRVLISDKQALQKWKEATKKLMNALKQVLLVSKGDLEKALADSSSETDATGRSQVPRVQARKLYISRFGVVSLVETRGSRENPTSDKAYLKLLSTLSRDERTEWGLKPKSMLS